MCTIILTIGPAFPSLSFFPFVSKDGIWIIALLIFEYSHCFLEIFFTEFSAVVDDEKDPISTNGEKIMLEGCWSEVGVYDMTGLRVDFGYPLRELKGVGNGCGKENVMDFIGKENNCFFPNDSTFYC